MTATAVLRKLANKIAPADVEKLGHAGQWEFVRHAGREYVLDDAPMTDELAARPAGPDEIRLVERVTEMQFGTAHEHTVTIRATAVPDGTFRRYREADERRHRLAAPKRAAPRDLLTRARQPDKVLPSPRGSRDLPAGALGSADGAVAAGILDGMSVGAFIPGKVAPVGLAGILAEARRASVELSVTASGRLLALAPAGRVLDDMVDRLRIAERLIVAHLGGTPLRCELDHRNAEVPLAESIVAVDVAACLAHAAGRLS